MDLLSKVYSPYSKCSKLVVEFMHTLSNRELDSLNEWLLANKLSLSIGEDKDTKYTLFSPTKYAD